MRIAMKRENPVDLYDNVYSGFGSDAEAAVRRQTYGEDIGQSSWMTRPEGRILFTDAMVITGTVSNEELAILTGSAAEVSQRWYDAREQQREALLLRDGPENFQGLQRFLRCVHTVSMERRLSRYSYLAQKQ
jgi:hypothetical protein